MRLIAALLLVGGLALAGSDGAWFPWPNLLGGVMILFFGHLGGRASVL